MKKFIYLASICFAMMTTSCEDFLTVSSPDKVTTGNFWKSQKDAEATMASVYAQLYHGDSYATSEVRWPVEAFRTDLYTMGNDAINYQTWTDLYKFTYTNGNTQFSYYYQDLYRGVNFANQVLEYVPRIPAEGISEEKREELMAEAHFMRGYYHLMLILNWEKIIIRDKYLTDQADLNKPLSERVDCWNFVVEEFNLAKTLPAQRPGTETGRATLGAVNAYLGFAHLTRAYEEPAQEEQHLKDALTALNAVTGYELVSGDALIDMFNGTNKNCKESIFELQYSNDNSNGARYYSWIHNFIAAGEMGGWDEILPNKFLMDEFKKEGKISSKGGYDERAYNTVFWKDEYWNDGTGKIWGYEYDDLFAEDRPAFRRFTPKTLDEMWERCNFNIPLMRYANVLLMKAEVLNKQGHPEQAIPIINDIRRIHGNMPAMRGTSQAEVQAQIEHERIIEFPLESYRWYDLRRWGKLNQQLGSRGFISGEHDFYPIPLWEVNANPAL